MAKINYTKERKLKSKTNPNENLSKYPINLKKKKVGTKERNNKI